MSIPVLTFDIDWAPDVSIRWVADRLIARKIKATWFVTHKSSAVEYLRQYPDLFELGIHPNFLPGSTHGTTITEVLKHCMDIVPDATSMRTHSLFQSSPLLNQIMAETNISIDVSLFLTYAPSLVPIIYQYRKRTLHRFPYFWEDDAEMECEAPCWHLVHHLTSSEGLKVFNFHPLLVHINATEALDYERVKRVCPQLNEVSAIDNSLIRSGLGVQTAFIELVDELASHYDTVQIRELYEHWRKKECVHKSATALEE